MTALEQRLRRRISREGPLTFADYMAAALYDPTDGYYAAGRPRTGWRGDFVTSPELHPLFGELWARFFDRVWHASGRPERFEIVEVGPGEGSFARSVLSHLPPDLAAATTLRLIEPFEGPRRRQQERLEGTGRVVWSTSMEDPPSARSGCVFANEVLDNLPVHLVTMHDGELKELWVTLGDGLELTSGEPSSPELAAHLSEVGATPAEGAVLEVGPELGRFVTNAARLHDRGAVVLLDYGREASELARRSQGTLAAYAPWGTDTEVLRQPGIRDITHHVDWTSVRMWLRRGGLEVAGPIPQRDMLMRLGLRELDAESRSLYSRATKRGDGRTAVRALARRTAAGALTDRGGLGALDVVVGLRDIPAPSVLGEGLG